MTMKDIVPIKTNQSIDDIVKSSYRLELCKIQYILYLKVK